MPLRLAISIGLMLALGAAATARADQTVPARGSGGTGGEPGTFANLNIDVDGRRRAYRLIVPAKALNTGKPIPIVFAFHGFLVDSKDTMPRYTKLDKLAEKHGFILVFPDAIGRMWQLIDPDKNRPDIRYFDTLLEHLCKRYDVDRNRVYATGMSNGAYFSNLLASRRSDVIAAIAPHSGGLGVLAFTGVNAKRKYPVMVVHGVNDRIVNIQQARETRDRYTKEGHDVEYVEVEKLNHFWAHRANINERIWKFFQAHPLDPDA